MPLVAQIPKNESFIKNFGSYRKYINVLSRKETAVQRQIRRGGLGSYESAFQAALMALCEQPSKRLVFYDIGSHIGIYSALIGVIFKRQSPSVFAFEPTPHTCKLCRLMRDANDLGYQVVQSAIAADTGSIEFYLSPKAESSNSMNGNFRKGSEKITVPVTTIDKYVSSGAPAPSIMKIDVETLEADVLSGSRKTIANHKPIITCEFLPRADCREGIGELMAWLQYYGYRFYQITETGPFDEYTASEVPDVLDSKLRDWILSPEPLSEAYYSSLFDWRSAMKTSEVETNILVEPGKLEPDMLYETW